MPRAVVPGGAAARDWREAVPVPAGDARDPFLYAAGDAALAAASLA